jgi:hypothetical protein
LGEQIKEDEIGRHGGHVEEKLDAYSFFAKPEEKRPLGKHWRGREENSKMDR